MLPDELGERTFQHAITGAVIRPSRAGGSSWIFLGEIFADAPVGILSTVDE